MTTFLATPRPAGAGQPPRPVVVAHRGSPGVAPQNTLASFETAWRAGAQVVEIDVHLSADGVPVVIHDATVDATTDGSGAVGRLPVDSLRELDAGSWFAPEFAGQRIPTLDEVLAFLATHPGMDLLCEYKGYWTPDEVAVTVGAVEAAGLVDRFMGQSFQPPTVAALREVAPTVPRALLAEGDHPDLVQKATALGAAGVSLAWPMISADPSLVARCHDAGLHVVAWTVNDKDTWATLVSAGVDGIITDHPDQLLMWLTGADDDLPTEFLRWFAGTEDRH
ncbi:glycerophosphodiester phosphodiesterase [Isoptericola sp. NEAU-Y5]|uniref:Glycerophosphodiester phosphodiesterase n=1 Tax=Isoptericola luteus TaxID=2879484 RepID=A0ABS7ZAR4_9MICO|nr:glycerophosphodiester phosphodiesterase family protein [Isoptericola sp. NEAU-Y5]MCA5892110.1 glycerophosphodiester phosphodiesterase [Isoptericola sp. NEAU-Y5]